MAEAPDEAPDLRLCFDSRVNRQVLLAALIHAFDVWDQIELVDAGSETGKSTEVSKKSQAIQPAVSRPAEPVPGQVHLSTASGEVLTGYALFKRLVRTLRLLWPLLPFTWLPI
jgi:hypothetical protein